MHDLSVLWPCWEGSLPKGAGVLSRVIWLAAVNQEQDAQSLSQAEIKKISLTLWRKLPANVEPAKNVEKSKKAEGNDQDTLEKKRLGLITEMKKNNAKTMTKKKKKVKDLLNLKSGSGDQQLIKQRFQRQEACMSLIIFLSTKNLLFVHLNFEMLSVIENSLNSSFIHSLDQIYM